MPPYKRQLAGDSPPSAIRACRKRKPAPPTGPPSSSEGCPMGRKQEAPRLQEEGAATTDCISQPQPRKKELSNKQASNCNQKPPFGTHAYPMQKIAEHRAPCSPGEVHICLSPGEVRFPFCLGAEMMGSMTSLSGSYSDSLEFQICQDLHCFSEEEQEEEQEQQLHHQSHTADSNGEVQPIGQAWDLLDTKRRRIEELRMELRRATEAILTAEPVSQSRQLEDRHCHGEEEEVEEKVEEDAEWQDGDHQNHYAAANAFGSPKALMPLQDVDKLSWSAGPLPLGGAILSMALGPAMFHTLWVADPGVSQWGLRGSESSSPLPMT
ncbi:uncharacterized protein LOC128343708 [Hemicordylus capensis]|uniref:uncharacterized protein LOC128343708 n=1 Tax=Hemicordylus capensis TaxID=884348 RepID=UPI002303BFFE|nr:uncharacterized protein LOC128343708 [Hemicordylus capensis]